MKMQLLSLAALFVATSHAQEASHKNKMAVIPFHYVIDQESGSEEVSYQVQADAFSIISKHAGGLELQDSETTNAKLFKAGITLENLRGFTYDEICSALGVEYVVSGTVKQHKNVSATSATNTAVKETPATTNNHGKVTSTGGVQATTTTTSYTSEQYTTTVTLNVHNDSGKSIFSESHQSTWTGPEAYKNTVNFLWKKTSLYVK